MWIIERTDWTDSDTDLYHVIHNETKERHTFTTYNSAYFIQQMFNYQERWYNWERHGYSTSLTGLSLTDPSSTYAFKNPPSANWKMEFGDDSNTWFTMYLKKGPNWFERKMFWWILGVKWSKL